MKLLLVRHGVAADRDEFAQSGEPDEKRPLTDDGRKKMKRAARGVSQIIKQIDVIATSPLTRALETADVLAKQYHSAMRITLDALVPEQSFDSFLEWLQRLDDVGVVAAVGHEPHLSGLASWLVTAEVKPLFEFKKGGMCLLEYDGPVERGAARIQWLLTPRQLRALKD